MTEILASNASAKDCVHFLPLDLASFESVKAAARTILAENDRLDVLINNAGIMAAPPGTTKEGYEVHFGTNYLSHCLLTQLLMPLMQRTASRHDVQRGSVRVVHVTSGAYALAPSFKGPDGSGIDVRDGTIKTDRKDVHGYDLYSITKLAQVWWAKETAKKWGGALDGHDGNATGTVLSVSVHPGRVKSSNILADFMQREQGCDMRKIVQKTFDALVPDVSTAQGAWTQVWAATAPMQSREAADAGKKATGVVNGAFYMPVGIRREDKKYRDDVGSLKLWEWTTQELRKYGVEFRGEGDDMVRPSII